MSLWLKNIGKVHYCELFCLHRRCHSSDMHHSTKIQTERNARYFGLVWKCSGMIAVLMQRMEKTNNFRKFQRAKRQLNAIFAIWLNISSMFGVEKCILSNVNFVLHRRSNTTRERKRYPTKQNINVKCKSCLIERKVCSTDKIVLANAKEKEYQKNTGAHLSICMHWISLTHPFVPERGFGSSNNAYYWATACCARACWTRENAFFSSVAVERLRENRVQFENIYKLHLNRDWPDLLQ